MNQPPDSAATAAPLSRPRRHGKLFDSLAEVGVTEDDYLAVQKARRIIDGVNARLAARGATVIHAVTCNPVGQMPGRTILETTT